MFPKFYKVFNYSSIVLVLIFLVLILTESIPKAANFTLLIITILILAARIVFRIYLLSYLKKTKGE
mgnify:CR=1 FL=1